MRALESPHLRGLFLSWFAWSGVACVFAIHFRFHYSTAWSTAFRWSIVDWYVWGALSWFVWRLSRRYRIWDGWKSVSVYVSMMLILSVLHDAAVILVDRLIATHSHSFATHLQELFTKKMGVNFLAYWVLVATFQALNTGRLQKDQLKTVRSEPDPATASTAPSPSAMKRILVPQGDREFFLDVSEIHYFEAARNYVRIHTRKGDFLIRRTLKSLENRLDERSFLRINRSILINLREVKEIRKWFQGSYQVLLQDGTEHRLSRRYRARLEKKMGDLF